MNLKARTLALALALGALAAPLTPGVAAAAGHHRAHHDGDRASYPMKADEFRKLMDKRIDAVRAAIDRKLERRGVSSDRKKAIHRIFDEASKDLRDEINRAAASGTVTQAAAEKAKSLATGLRARVRERIRAEKSPKLKEKLAREEAAKKDHGAHKKAPPAGADHPGGGHTKASSDDPPAGHPKASPDRPPPASKTKKAKANPAGAPASGPTRTAKAPARKKHKQPKVDPGAL